METRSLGQDKQTYFKELCRGRGVEQYYNVFTNEYSSVKNIILTAVEQYVLVGELPRKLVK
jgi:hypothetical protein